MLTINEQDQQPAWGIALGLLPAAASILVDATKAFLLLDVEVLSFLDVILFLLMLAIYVAVSRRQKQIPLWTLPGLGMIFPGIVWHSYVIVSHLSNSPCWGMEFIAPVGLLVVGGLSVLGIWIARRAHGSVAILVVLPTLFAGIFGFFNEGWSYNWPYSWAWAHLLEAGLNSILLILLPILVLRQKRSSWINWLVTGLSLLTMELAVAARWIDDIFGHAQPSSMVIPSPVSIQEQLISAQIMVAVMLLPIVGLLALYTYQGRSRDGGVHSPLEPAVDTL